MKILFVFALFLLTSSMHVSAEPPLVDPPDLRNIQFPEGQPPVDGDFQPTGEMLSNLEEAAGLLRMAKNMSVNVTGSTDSKECAAAECVALGMRRAKFVYDWLDRHGVERRRLGKISSTGSDSAIASNTTDDRRFNRRVEFEILSESSN